MNHQEERGDAEEQEYQRVIASITTSVCEENRFRFGQDKLASLNAFFKEMKAAPEATVEKPIRKKAAKPKAQKMKKLLPKAKRKQPKKAKPKQRAKPAGKKAQQKQQAKPVLPTPPGPQLYLSPLLKNVSHQDWVFKKLVSAYVGLEWVQALVKSFIKHKWDEAAPIETRAICKYLSTGFEVLITGLFAEMVRCKQKNPRTFRRIIDAGTLSAFNDDVEGLKQRNALEHNLTCVVDYRSVYLMIQKIMTLSEDETWIRFLSSLDQTSKLAHWIYMDDLDEAYTSLEQFRQASAISVPCDTLMVPVSAECRAYFETPHEILIHTYKTQIQELIPYVFNINNLLQFMQVELDKTQHFEQMKNRWEQIATSTETNAKMVGLMGAMMMADQHNLILWLLALSEHIHTPATDLPDCLSTFELLQNGDVFFTTLLAGIEKKAGFSRLKDMVTEIVEMINLMLLSHKRLFIGGQMDIHIENYQQRFLTGAGEYQQDSAALLLQCEHALKHMLCSQTYENVLPYYRYYHNSFKLIDLIYSDDRKAMLEKFQELTDLGNALQYGAYPSLASIITKHLNLLMDFALRPNEKLDEANIFSLFISDFYALYEYTKSFLSPHLGKVLNSVWRMDKIENLAKTPIDELDIDAVAFMNSPEFLYSITCELQRVIIEYAYQEAKKLVEPSQYSDEVEEAAKRFIVESLLGLNH